MRNLPPPPSFCFFSFLFLFSSFISFLFLLLLLFSPIGRKNVLGAWAFLLIVSPSFLSFTLYDRALQLGYGCNRAEGETRGGLEYDRRRGPLVSAFADQCQRSQVTARALCSCKLIPELVTDCWRSHDFPAVRGRCCLILVVRGLVQREARA